MDRLPFEILSDIIEYSLPLNGPVLDKSIPARFQRIRSLSCINRQLRWVCLYLLSRDLFIPSRSFYEGWVSKLESLPRDHILNTRCRSLELQPQFELCDIRWFWRHNLMGSKVYVDSISYFMGNVLTQKGLFPNLRTIHIHFGSKLTFDPYGFLFTACLPKSVNALYLHFYFPVCKINAVYFGVNAHRKMVFRSTPIRFSSRKHPLEILDILVLGDKRRNELGRLYYTDAPIFHDMARVWGSLFDAVPRLFIGGIQVPIDKPSKHLLSLDMNKALECYSKRQPLEGMGWRWCFTTCPPGGRTQDRKKKGIRRLVKKFATLKSFLKMEG